MFGFFWNIPAEVLSKKTRAVHYDGPGMDGQGVCSFACNWFHRHCESRLSAEDSKEQVSLAKECNCHFLNHHNSTNELS